MVAFSSLFPSIFHLIDTVNILRAELELRFNVRVHIIQFDGEKKSAFSLEKLN